MTMNRMVGSLLGLLGLLHVGCFNTTGIKNGGLQCGSGGTCPDGFTCVKDGQPGQAGHCYRAGAVADASVGPGPDTLAGPVCGLPFGPFGGCKQATPADSKCDPVCQAACGCGQRCILDPVTYSNFVCEGQPSAPGTTFVPHAGECQAEARTLCAPGAVCLEDDQKLCPNLCYKTCRSNLDCPDDSRCTIGAINDSGGRLVEGVYLCSPPIKTCNPTGLAECLPRKANFKCVFMAGLTGVASDASTICDCASTHDKKPGEKCSRLPDDCQPGSVCVEGTCRTLCTLKTALAPCPTRTQTCTPIYSSQVYGYCP